MTSFKNSILINHRIKFAPAGAPEKADLVTGASLREFFNYALREGKLEAEKGVDGRVTKDDMRLEQMKAFTKDITQSLLYGTRSGVFAGKGEEMPIVEGDTGGEVWDEFGVCDYHEVEQEILASGSNVVQSVFTVSREWTQELGMTCKEDFQRIMRSKWTEFMGAWGVIPAGNERWVAEYHLDGKKSLHVHVLSWDSGKNGLEFTGKKKKIPHQVIRTSQEVIRKEVAKGIFLERSIMKGWARDAMKVRAAYILGMKVGNKARDRIAEKSLAAGKEAPRDGAFSGKEDIDKLLERVALTLPEDQSGRAAYASLSVDCRTAANLCVQEMLKDEQMQAMYEDYLKAVEIGADILGKEGKDREDYLDKAKEDLRMRLANSVIVRAVQVKSPWMLDKQLVQEQRSLVDSMVKKIGEENLGRIAAIMLSDIQEGHDAIRKAVDKAMEKGSKSVKRFQDKAFKQMAEAMPSIGTEQEEKLRAEIKSSIRRGVEADIARQVVKETVRGATREDMACEKEMFRAELRGKNVLLPNKQKSELNKCYSDLKIGLKTGTDKEELFYKCLPTIVMVMNLPEFKESFERAWKVKEALIPEAEYQKEYNLRTNAIFQEMIKYVEVQRNAKIDVIAAIMGAALTTTRTPNIGGAQEKQSKKSKRKAERELMVRR